MDCQEEAGTMPHTFYQKQPLSLPLPSFRTFAMAVMEAGLLTLYVDVM